MITIRVNGPLLREMIDPAKQVLGTDARWSTQTVRVTPRAASRRGINRVATLSVVPLYAAYGSNMDPAQMMERAPHSPMAGTGWLVGWRLTFGAEDLTWEGSLATIVEDPDSQVFVVFYDMMPEDEERLDSWEGSDLGLHKKIRLRVQTLEGS